MWKRLGRARLSVLVALTLCFSACSASSIPGAVAGQPQPIPTAASRAAQTYLLTAFDFVQQYYHYRNRVDWAALKRKVFQRAQNARTPSETYPAIRVLLSALRPSAHTFFLPPKDARLDLTQPNTSVSIGAVGVRQPDGLTVVAAVAPHSPAADAGIQPGDVVLREDGHLPPPPKAPVTGFTSYGPTVSLQVRHRDQGPAFTVTLRAQPNQLNQYPDSRPLASGIGYLDLPSFGYGSPQGESYAADAQGAIRSLAPSASCGWIVDLRRDLGGDFYPMLGGVGPLLGDGPAGSFVTPAGVRIEWSYENGTAVGEGTSLQVPNAYQLTPADPAVAVLTSGLTASAGEATLISFLGRPNTRTFGQPTYGAPSAPMGHLLSDGAFISVVAAVDADRTGHVYQDHVPIRPEEAVTPDWTQIGLNSDPTLKAAEAWLKAQPACAG